MQWTIVIVAALIMSLAASDVTARNHAAAEAEVRKYLADIRRATMDADIDDLERLLHEDFTFIDAAGTLVRRYDIIDAFSKKVAVVEKWSYDLVEIRIYGTTAIVTGISDVQQRTLGRDTSGPFRFTRVLIKDGGQWRSVAMQTTRR